MKKYITAIKWYIKGKPIPTPHIIKQLAIRACRGDRNILIETGTYLGEMVEVMQDTFTKIKSIELDPKLYADAKAKFQNRSSIEIFNGDSGEVLVTLLSNITEPTVFWLDGHYSGGITSKGSLNTPIYRELEAIFANPIKNHAILIDDAHCFIGKDDYPTLDELQKFISTKTNSYSFKVSNNIIRITYT